MPLILSVLVFSFASFAAPSDNLVKIDKYIDGLIKEGPPADTTFASDAKAVTFDLEEKLKTEYPSGIAYGAIITKTIPFKYADIKARLLKPGAIYEHVSTVKTQRNFTKVEEKPNFLNVKLAIKVPVFSDILTQDIIKISESAKGFGVLEWRQVGTDGNLEYNRGLVLSIPDGDKTKIFVVGIHILKPDRKIPWVGRATATQFAKTHYSGYITALEDMLRK